MALLRRLLRTCWEGMGGGGWMQGVVWRDGSYVRTVNRCVRMALAEWMMRQKKARRMVVQRRLMEEEEEEEKGE